MCPIKDYKCESCLVDYPDQFVAMTEHPDCPVCQGKLTQTIQSHKHYVVEGDNSGSTARRYRGRNGKVGR
jgi:hypothetical protein